MIPLKTNTLQDDYEVILSMDPALDTDVKDFDKRWKLYRDGKGEPPLRDGQDPTIFKMAHLSAPARDKVRDLMLRRENYGAARFAAMAALKSFRCGDDVREPSRGTSLGFQVADPQVIALLPDEAVHELGLLVWDKEQLLGKS